VRLGIALSVGNERLPASIEVAMNKMIAAASAMLLVLLAGCAASTMPQASDGSYQSVPAHPAAPASAQASNGPAE